MADVNPYGSCNCVGFTFICGDETTFTIRLYRTMDLFNGYPRYVGEYGSKIYEIYYKGYPGSPGPPQYWVFRETDPLYPDPILFYPYNTSNFCSTNLISWLFNDDATNFNYCLDSSGGSGGGGGLYEFDLEDTYVPPIGIIEKISNDLCIPRPIPGGCDTSKCWSFSAISSSYMIAYSNTEGDKEYFRLNSGDTVNFCVLGDPEVFPPYHPDFYSGQTSDYCNLGCRPYEYCECLNVIINETDDMGFVVGGTLNSKTFWKTNYDSNNYIIYWSGEKWLLELLNTDIRTPGTILMESDFDESCPPTGSSVDNWVNYTEDTFYFETDDCYPNLSPDRKCWSLTSTTYNEIITFYDGLDSQLKKVILINEGDIMVVCSKSKPISSSPSTYPVETTGSCYTICDSIDMCGCIKTVLECIIEDTESTSDQINSITPSGLINGKPFYISGPMFIYYSYGYWIYSDVDKNINMAYSSGGECPYENPWTIEPGANPCRCVTPWDYFYVRSLDVNDYINDDDYNSESNLLRLDIGTLSFTVLPKICPQLPTPTPTPTPVPVPYVTPMRNECVPTALFDMFTICQPTNPTSPSSPDGSITLLVSGGTGPYNIVWSNGNIGPSIYNLMEGSYTATTTDYYGDFTSTTICELVAAQPTTTTTTTTEPPIDEYTLCMTISTIQSTGTTTESITFQPNGMFNGKPSWSSTNGDSLIWNNVSLQWNVIFDPTRTYYVLSLDSSYPPLYNWIVVGLSGSVSVVEGECSVMEPMMMRKKTTSFKSLMIDGSNLGGFSN